MVKRKPLLIGVLSIIVLLVLIIDYDVVMSGAYEGVQLCINTVIPALFPFLIISAVINQELTGRGIPLLRSFGQLCGIPSGCESLLILGLVGGYPVGAKAVSDAYRNKKISANTAKRMLGFCNNAGPAFIFGLVASQFDSILTAFIIWLIHIVSALLVGILLPGKNYKNSHMDTNEQSDINKIIDQSIRTMGSICGWVILFKVIITMLKQRLFFLLPEQYSIIISGLLELTNGCCDLPYITEESIRFVICSCFLSFGGLCVLMQTHSVTKDLCLGMYWHGKILQTLISFFLAGLAQRMYYKNQLYVSNIALITVIVLIIIFEICLFRKNSSIAEINVV